MCWAHWSIVSSCKNTQCIRIRERNKHAAPCSSGNCDPFFALIDHLLLSDWWRKFQPNKLWKFYGFRQTFFGFTIWLATNWQIAWNQIRLTDCIVHVKYSLQCGHYTKWLSLFSMLTQTNWQIQVFIPNVFEIVPIRFAKGLSPNLANEIRARFTHKITQCEWNMCLYANRILLYICSNVRPFHIIVYDFFFLSSSLYFSLSRETSFRKHIFKDYILLLTISFNLITLQNFWIINKND